MHHTFLVINGPNLNLLGIREPELYGEKSYQDLIFQIKNYCLKKNWRVEFYQSNHEGDLIDKIHEAYFNQTDGIIINPGAYAHTSIALYDAIKAVSIPSVEVHISNIENREDFRQVDYLQKACLKTINGYGFLGYLKALDFLANHLAES